MMLLCGPQTQHRFCFFLEPPNAAHQPPARAAFYLNAKKITESHAIAGRLHGHVSPPLSCRLKLAPLLSGGNCLAA
jgi:hypothetical protein